VGACVQSSSPQQRAAVAALLALVAGTEAPHGSASDALQSETMVKDSSSQATGFSQYVLNALRVCLGVLDTSLCVVLQVRFDDRPSDGKPVVVGSPTLPRVEVDVCFHEGKYVEASAAIRPTRTPLANVLRRLEVKLELEEGTLVAGRLRRH